MTLVALLFWQDLLDVLEPWDVQVVSYPGAPHLGPVSDLFKALNAKWLSDLVVGRPRAPSKVVSSWATILKDRIAQRSKQMVCGRRGWLFAGLKKDALALLSGLQVGFTKALGKVGWGVD